MTDLLTPEKIRKELTAANDAAARETDPDIQRAYLRIGRICRDYLTLWDERDNEKQIANDVVQDWEFEKRAAERLRLRVEELEKDNEKLINCYKVG